MSSCEENLNRTHRPSPLNRPERFRFVEPVYYDPADYFDVTHHEVDRQDELEYEVRAR